MTSEIPYFPLGEMNLLQCGNRRSRSDAVGQERPISDGRDMSACPPIATTDYSITSSVSAKKFGGSSMLVTYAEATT